MIGCFLIAVLLILTASSSAVRVSSNGGGGGLLSYQHVSVSSELTGGKVLLVHCKSADDDLGIHNLTAGSEFKWQFVPLIQGGTTLFWCYLAPDDSHHASFEAYNNDHRIYEYKTHTYWIGKDDGVYAKLVDKNVDMLVYHWLD
ncbi:unnamed protein product [Linum tenue]|uniref:S-protein homolog n=1 Tax=Linum tenue TaxID=586396 RepID=A0AAV0M6W4_9ROSI|nr:unnamed protein product [Linum tenue]